MIPIKFPQANVTFAENQPEYQPLPALRKKNGEVITCWELNEEEKAQMMMTGKIYLRQLTFNQALQPINLTVEPTDFGL